MSHEVILSIGSNQGNRLQNLRQALRALQAHLDITVLDFSPVYISDALLPERAPENWQTYYLNAALRCSTQLSPQALLLEIKKIEKSLGRMPAGVWAPRIIDIDILCFDDLRILEPNLQVPHKELLNRPFALWPLLDLKPKFENVEFQQAAANWAERSGDQAFHTRQIAQQIVGPELVGIINLTPDSCTNDGILDNPEAVLKQAQDFFAAGASILDLGAESTNPKSTPLSHEEEFRRLRPVIDSLNQQWSSAEFRPKISIDTYHVETVEKILAYQVDMINDVSGQDTEGIASLLKGSDRSYVFMHNLGIPTRSEHTLPKTCDPVREILSWAQQRKLALLKFGLREDQLIFDPGIGFGTSPQQSLEILGRINEFSELELSVYVGHSRKSWLSQFTAKPYPERDFETALVTSYLTNKCVDYLRVHNVFDNNQSIRLSAKLNFQNLGRSL